MRLTSSIVPELFGQHFDTEYENKSTYRGRKEVRECIKNRSTSQIKQSIMHKKTEGKFNDDQTWKNNLTVE